MPALASFDPQIPYRIRAGTTGSAAAASTLSLAMQLLPHGLPLTQFGVFVSAAFREQCRDLFRERHPEFSSFYQSGAGDAQSLPTDFVY